MRLKHDKQETGNCSRSENSAGKKTLGPSPISSNPSKNRLRYNQAYTISSTCKLTCI